jgi:hypothetical protein
MVDNSGSHARDRPWLITSNDWPIFALWLPIDVGFMQRLWARGM